MQASFQYKSRSRRTSHHSGYTYAHIESSKSSLSHDDMVRHHSSFAIRQLQGTSSWTSSLSHANKNQTTDRTLPLYHSYTPNPKITPPTPATTKSANFSSRRSKTIKPPPSQIVKYQSLHSEHASSRYIFLPSLETRCPEEGPFCTLQSTFFLE